MTIEISAEQLSILLSTCACAVVLCTDDTLTGALAKYNVMNHQEQIVKTLKELEKKGAAADPVFAAEVKAREAIFDASGLNPSAGKAERV